MSTPTTMKPRITTDLDERTRQEHWTVIVDGTDLLADLEPARSPSILADTLLGAASRIGRDELLVLLAELIEWGEDWGRRAEAGLVW